MKIEPSKVERNKLPNWLRTGWINKGPRRSDAGRYSSSTAVSHEITSFLGSSNEMDNFGKTVIDDEECFVVEPPNTTVERLYAWIQPLAQLLGCKIITSEYSSIKGTVRLLLLPPKKASKKKHLIPKRIKVPCPPTLSSLTQKQESNSSTNS